MRVTYQGQPVSDFSFQRTNGVRPDRFHVVLPYDPNTEIEAVHFVDRFKTKHVEEPSDDFLGKLKKKVISLSPSGVLDFETENKKTGLTEEITIKEVYIDDKVQDETVLYPSVATHRKINLTDVRWLWSKMGSVSGDYNVIATNENCEYLSWGEKFYVKRTVSPYLETATPWSLEVLIRLCVSNLPYSYNEIGFPLSFGEGILAAGGDPKETVTSDMISIARIIPDNIKWGGGTNAAKALNTLLSRYGLVLSLTLNNDIIISRSGYGIDYVKKYSQHLSSRKQGSIYNKSPLSVNVVGKKVRQEHIIYDWIPIIKNEGGNIEPLDDALRRWGLLPQYVQTQVVLEADQQFTSIAPGQTLREEKIREKRIEILKTYAYKYFQVNSRYKPRLPLLPAWDFGRPITKPGEKHEKFIISGYFIVPKKTKAQGKGHLTMKWYEDASEVASVEPTTGRIKTSTPCGITLPMNKLQDYVETFHSYETQKAMKIRDDLKIPAMAALKRLKALMANRKKMVEDGAARDKNFDIKFARRVKELLDKAPGPWEYLLSCALGNKPESVAAKIGDAIQYRQAYMHASTSESAHSFSMISRLGKCLIDLTKEIAIIDKRFHTYEVENSRFVPIWPILRCSCELKANLPGDYYSFLYGVEGTVPTTVKDNSIQLYIGLTRLWQPTTKELLPGKFLRVPPLEEGFYSDYGFMPGSLRGEEYLPFSNVSGVKFYKNYLDVGIASNVDDCNRVAKKTAITHLSKAEPFQTPIDEVTLAGLHQLDCDGKIISVKFSVLNNVPVTTFVVNLRTASEYIAKMHQLAEPEDYHKLLLKYVEE